MEKTGKRLKDILKQMDNQSEKDTKYKRTETNCCNELDFGHFHGSARYGASEPPWPTFCQLATPKCMHEYAPTVHPLNTHTWIR